MLAQQPRAIPQRNHRARLRTTTHPRSVLLAFPPTPPPPTQPWARGPGLPPALFPLSFPPPLALTHHPHLAIACGPAASHPPSIQ